METCEEGHGDCNDLDGDGCETDLRLLGVDVRVVIDEHGKGKPVRIRIKEDVELNCAL